MTLWISCATLTLVVLTLLVRPLLRRQGAPAERLDYDLVVYRDQLAEVERDSLAGLLENVQAVAARTEIQRRILAAAERQSATAEGPSRQSGRWLRLLAAMVILLGVPAATLLLYGRLGAPDLPAQPYAARVNSPEFKYAAMIARLQARLRQAPDAKGYALLGDSLRKTGRSEEAVEAYRQMVALGGDAPESLAVFGETLIEVSDGLVTAEASQLFQRVLRADPGDPRGRFYLGLAAEQAGQSAEALGLWRALERDSPADAPWLAMLRQRIAALVQQTGMLTNGSPAVAAGSPGQR